MDYAKKIYVENIFEIKWKYCLLGSDFFTQITLC